MKAPCRQTCAPQRVKPSLPDLTGFVGAEIKHAHTSLLFSALPVDFLSSNTHSPLSPQVLEDTTGVRRVVVTPQSPECYPPSYSPALSPTHHLPPYLAHPHFIPNSHSFYPPVSPGELPPHQYYQHHLPHMYGDPGTNILAADKTIRGGLMWSSKPAPRCVRG